VNAWWWVPIGLAAWLGVSLVVGLWLGPAFKRSSQAREALDPHTEEPPVGGKSRLRMGRTPPRGNQARAPVHLVASRAVFLAAAAVVPA
jgi:hypothetical protein